jgi:hypothetical protein
MVSNRARQLKRERQRVDRKRGTRAARARDTQLLQATADARQSWRQRRRRHAIAYVMFAVAVVLAVSHFFEHYGALRLMSSGLEDLFIGWPMAAILALSGAIIYGT